MFEKYYGLEAPLVDISEFPSWILHEDEDFLVINKPGWLVCHPSKNGPLSSLVGAAREYSKIETLHLVSRLDRETSGVVMLAKHKKAASIAQKAMEERSVKKDYIAFLEGRFQGSATVAQPLIEDENSLVAIKQACCVRKGGAKNSVTIFKSLGVSNSETPFSLVLADLITGRKHQIRAHAQWLDYPVVGDKIYGHDETLYLDFIENGITPEMENRLLMPRQALHAWRMDFSKVLGGLIFTAPLHQDMLSFASTWGIDLDPIKNL